MQCFKWGLESEILGSVVHTADVSNTGVWNWKYCVHEHTQLWFLTQSQKIHFVGRYICIHQASFSPFLWDSLCLLVRDLHFEYADMDSSLRFDHRLDEIFDVELTLQKLPTSLHRLICSKKDVIFSMFLSCICLSLYVFVYKYLYIRIILKNF